jgi:hypothetical protein
MNHSKTDCLPLLGVDRMLTAEEDRALAHACRQTLTDYRKVVIVGVPSAKLATCARRALLHLGGDPARSGASVKHYDHIRYGPFLGVSDEGSAAGQIREAAFDSPKVRALPKTLGRTPLAVGVAVDAERLGGIGEVAVGPDEYARVWLEAVDRLLITTNIGTRVNMRVYRREPLVVISRDTPEATNTAKAEIVAAFKPFIETPNKRPRPLTVFIDIPRYARIRPARKREMLSELVEFVSSGEAAGAGKKTAPPNQQLGLATWVRLGPSGRDEAIAAIDLAASVGMRVVVLDGVKRKAADRAVSLAGLLEYFPPGLVGPLLRHAAKRNIQIRTANLPDTNTIARSTWVGLTTARNFGAHLGKYGCFPLTRSETDHVVGHIQAWLSDWSPAPVFFVDQGLLREGGVDVKHDVARGLRYWLQTVAAHSVRVVLIDTVDKATGKRLLKRFSKDNMGFLGPSQVRKAEALAHKLGIKVLWAGGLDLRDVYFMGKLGVFGIYVTSAAATTIPVSGSYTHDPALAGLKEPSKEEVLRTKIILEAGFLCTRLVKDLAAKIEDLAEKLLEAYENRYKRAVATHTPALASACEAGWHAYWKTLAIKRKKTQYG